MVGHTRLLRWADRSYIDAAAVDEFPDRGARNGFFAAVGALPGPDAATRAKLDGMEATEAYAYLTQCSRSSAWL